MLLEILFGKKEKGNFFPFLPFFISARGLLPCASAPAHPNWRCFPRPAPRRPSLRGLALRALP